MFNKKSFLLKEIISCQKTKAFGRYLGVGVRYGFDGSMAYTTSFGEAVEVAPKAGRTFVFSSKKPDKVCEIIKKECAPKKILYSLLELLDSAELLLGDFTVSIDELRKIDWSNLFVLLIGCETAAIDSKNGDIASTLLELGARAVVGTSTKISMDVAKVFLQEFFINLMAGAPADYSFFYAKRKAVLHEALSRIYQGKDFTNEINALFTPEKKSKYMSMTEMLTKFGITWEQAGASALYAFSLSILGGAGERLV